VRGIGSEKRKGIGKEARKDEGRRKEGRGSCLHETYSLLVPACDVPLPTARRLLQRITVVNANKL